MIIFSVMTHDVPKTMTYGDQLIREMVKLMNSSLR